MLVNGMNFTVGADPEIFVKKDGLVRCAHGLVEGDKARPQRVNKGAVQVDGMALEFNIDPANSYEEFETNLSTVREQLGQMIGDHEFTNDVSVLFEEDYIKTLPIEALLLGCDEDYNGYTMAANPAPDGQSNMRTVGGHVHVGGFESDDPFVDHHFSTSARLARLLDEQIGIYSLFWDKDDKRRTMYGRAGSFRPKEYGMEYRTLSNSWIFDNRLVKFVFDGVQNALELMFDQHYEPHPEVQQIIDGSVRNHQIFKNNPRADEVRSIMEA